MIVLPSGNYSGASRRRTWDPQTRLLCGIGVQELIVGAVVPVRGWCALAKV